MTDAPCKFANMCRYCNANKQVCAQDSLAITSCGTYPEFERIIDLKRAQLPMVDVVLLAKKTGE